MPNHYHVLVETLRPELSAGIRRLNGLYSQGFNRRHDRVGHLFQGRFKSLLIDHDSYFLAVHRYIHQNPVRSGLSQEASDYEWSSCRDFLGLREPPSWLETQRTLELFPGDCAERQAAYAAFLENKREDDLFANAYGQAFLGSPEFIETMRARAKPLVLATPEHPARKDFMDRADPRLIRTAIERHLSGPNGRISGLRSPTKTLALYLLRERALLSLNDLAAQFELSLSGVNKQVARFKSRMLRDQRLALLIAAIESDLGVVVENVQCQDLTPAVRSESWPAVRRARGRSASGTWGPEPGPGG